MTAMDGYLARLKADQQNLIWLAWHGAAFQRAKKMPAFKSLIDQQPTSPAGLSAQIKAHFMALPKAK